MPAPTSTNLWIGTPAIMHDPMRLQWSEDAAGVTATIVLTGPFADLAANLPRRGQSLPNLRLPQNPLVEKITLTSPAPGVGEATVSLRREFSGDPGGTPSTADQPVFEREMATDEKDLEANPYFAEKLNHKTAFPRSSFTEKSELEAYDTAFGKETASIEFSLLELLQRCKNAEINVRNFLIKNSGEPAVLEEFFTMYDSGQKTYKLGYPVLRKTTRSTLLPDAQKIYVRQPPQGFPSIPTGYKWLKTADRANRSGRNGKWERTEEWTGAQEWNTKIYPTG